MPVSTKPRKIRSKRLDQKALKQRQALESTWCERPRGWVYVVCEAGSEYWRPRRCRNCDGCAAAARAAVEHRIHYGMEQFDHNLFVTLTSTPGANWTRLCTLWSRIVQRIRKKYGATEFVVVKQEGGDTGMMHFHAVMSGPRYIPYEWLSAWWEKHSGAFMVWIEKATPAAAEELSQYLVAGVSRKGKVSYKKGVSFSKGWPKPPACATVVKGDDLDFEMNIREDCILWLPTLRLVVAPTKKCYCGQHEIFWPAENES